MNRKALIIGGGITGMQTAVALSRLGIPSMLVEKRSSLGGRVLGLSRVVPFQESGRRIVAGLVGEVRASPLIQVRCGAWLTRVEGDSPRFWVGFSDGVEEAFGAIVLATGFEPFDPSGLKEFGYRIYHNVVTASELEQRLSADGRTDGELISPMNGSGIRRLAIIFCVGSRSRVLGAPFCSRICCSYSTKQAIQVKEQAPEAQVTCFYMDVRTYDRGFEEMYARAQALGVRYIRGRVSSCKQTSSGAIQVRAENTLVGRSFTGEFDLVSLSTGMRPCEDAAELAGLLRLRREQQGFFDAADWYRRPQDTSRLGVFFAGGATGAKPVRDCLIEGAAVAARVASRLVAVDQRVLATV